MLQCRTGQGRVFEKREETAFEIRVWDDVAAVTEHCTHRRNAVAAAGAKRLESGPEVFAPDEVVPLCTVGCMLDTSKVGDRAEIDECPSDGRARDPFDDGAVGAGKRARRMHAKTPAPVSRAMRHEDLDDIGIATLESVQPRRGAMRSDAAAGRAEARDHYPLLPRRGRADNPEDLGIHALEQSLVHAMCEHPRAEFAFVRLCSGEDSELSFGQF
jgi:hypothetical protein